MVANTGPDAALDRVGDGQSFKPGSRGEQLSLEVSKYQALRDRADLTAADPRSTPAERDNAQAQRNDLDHELKALRRDLADLDHDPAAFNQLSSDPVEVKRPARVWLDPNGKLPRDVSARASFDRLQTGAAKQFPNAERVTLDKDSTLTLTDGTKVRSFGDHTNVLRRFTDPVSEGGYGGAVFHDRATDTVIVAVNMARESTPNVVSRVEVPFARNAEGEWRADFSQNSVYRTRIDPNLEATRRIHFKAANNKLAEAWRQDPSIKESLKLSDPVAKTVEDSEPFSPDPYTWHHINGGGDIELIDAAIHGFFLHRGGILEWQGRGNAQ